MITTRKHAKVNYTVKKKGNTGAELSAQNQEKIKHGLTER